MKQSKTNKQSTNKQDLVRKHMTFSRPMVEVLEKKAERIGFTFTDYVRFVLAKEVEEEIEERDATAAEEDAIKKAREDVKNGTFLSFDSPEDLKKYLKNL